MADTPHIQPSPDESLEARIVAMVVGEASDFEKAELTEILATRPDLQEFARRIGGINRLAEAALSESAKKQGAEWRLAPEKRHAVMAKFAGPGAGVTATAPARRPKAFGRRFWMAMAACFAVLVSSYVALQILTYQGLIATLGASGISDPRAMDADRAWWNRFGVDAALQRSSRLSAADQEATFSGSGGGDGFVAQAEDSSSFAVLQEATAMGTLSASASVGGAGQSVPVMSGRLRVEPVAESSVVNEMAAAVPSQVRDFTEGWGVQQAPASPAPNRRLSGLEQPLSETRDGLVQYGVALDSLKMGDARITLPMIAPSPAATPASRERKKERIPARPLFESVSETAPVSTFSLHVADVSFRLALTELLENRRPDPERIRSEEFTAAFDYGDPGPAAGEAVSLAQDQSMHPFTPQSNLLRVSLRTAAEGRATDEPLNLMVLLDKSGSMERLDRSMATANTLRALGSQLREQDRVTVVTFDRQARLVESALPGNAAVERLLEIQRTVGESGTNIEEALDAALSIANGRAQDGGAHRVLLITDGVANLGSTLPERIADPVRELRSRGIALDVVAVGAAGMGDEILQELARHGDGRYFLMEDERADAAALAQRLAGAFRPAARNVKVQVRWNPQRVSEYSLLGFESHRLREEDFRDDSVDAAELAAAEQGSAVYQIRLLPDGRGEVGEISVRFEEVATGRMVERSWVIPFLHSPPALDEAAPSHQLAAAATLTAEFLQQSPTGQLVRMEDLEPVVTQLESHFSGNSQVNLLARMVRAIRKIY